MDKKIIIGYNENVFYRSPASIRNPSNKTVLSHGDHAVLHSLCHKKIILNLNHCRNQQSRERDELQSQGTFLRNR